MEKGFSVVMLVSNVNKPSPLEERLSREYNLSIEKRPAFEFSYNLWRKKEIDGYHEFQTPCLYDSAKEKYFFGEEEVIKYLSNPKNVSLPNYLLDFSEKQ